MISHTIYNIPNTKYKKYLAIFFVAFLLVGLLGVPNQAQALGTVNFDANPKLIDPGVATTINFTASFQGFSNQTLISDCGQSQYVAYAWRVGTGSAAVGTWTLLTDEQLQKGEGTLSVPPVTLTLSRENYPSQGYRLQMLCVSKADTSRTQYEKILTESAIVTVTSVRKIEFGSLRGEWTTDSTVYRIHPQTTQFEIKLKKVGIKSGTDSNYYIQPGDRVYQGPDERTVSSFYFGIDFYGKDPQSWQCDQVFPRPNVCIFPGSFIYENPNKTANPLVGNDYLTFPVHLGFTNSDKGIVIPNSERKIGNSKGLAIYPVVRVGASITESGVDVPIITGGQFTITFDDKVPVNQAQGDNKENPISGGEGVNVSTAGFGEGVAASLISVVNIIIGVITGILRWIVWFIGSVILVPQLNTILQLRAEDIAGGVILTGWSMVRDVVNMFFILVLIIIAFGTILRIETYSYKKLLVNLIVMAMLVNFSLVIGRIIIQIADIVQFTFLPAGDLPGQPSGTTGINLLFKSLSTVQLSSILDGFRGFTFNAGDAAATTFSLIFQFILEFGVILTFGALSIFMLIRTVGLWILLIISPIAYALFILPTTAGLARKWWSTFLKYAMFAPIIAFFLRLTLELYRNGLQIFPETTNWYGKGDLITQISERAAKGDTSFQQALGLALIYVVILAFMWAGMIVTRQMGIAGASAIVGFAERGLKAPFALGWKGTKMLTGALAGFGAQKILERYGKEIRPQVWWKGWKESREINKMRREQRGMLRAEGRSTLANPVAFFQRYWGKGAVHAIKGDNRRGIQLREEAKKELEVAEKAHVAGTISDAEYQTRQRNAEAKASEGFRLIHPADYFTQRKTREAVNKEKANVLGETWQELFDLAEGARREKHADRYLALFERLAETYNENELVNHTRYTRDMDAGESADRKAHKKGEFFQEGWSGWENFRKLILEEDLGLTQQASMRFMGDIGELAKEKKHFGVWRLFDTKWGQYRHKPREEWETEIRIEKGKMGPGLKLTETNRLGGHDEVPSLTYDVDGVRVALTQENEIDDTVNLIDNVKFLINRGQFNSSKARALAFAPNMARLEQFARDHLDNTVRYMARDLRGAEIKDAAGRTMQWTKRDEALYTLGELRKFGEAQYLPGEMEKHTEVFEALLRADKIEDYYRDRMKRAGYLRTPHGVVV